MSTAFYTDERFAQHNYPGHPEHAGRLQAITELIVQARIISHLTPIKAQPATQQQLLAIHTEDHLDRLAEIAQLDRPVMLGMDTYILPVSYELAQMAAGGTIAVVDSVLSGEHTNGMAAVRPPGHHATPSQGMGFCLLNNIAIAARHAITFHRLERVAIVDFDVHHGNGTQDAFYDDGQVLFISTHQSPLYPGTGMMDEIGTGAGKGTTINVPVPAGTGDKGLRRIFEQIVAPALKRFQPELILVSAGFDAHWVDPLANLNLSLAGFDSLVRTLITTANDLCAGRIVFVSEGGYDLKALSFGWLNVACALTGQDILNDPIGPAYEERSLPEEIIANVIEQHNLK